MISWKGSHRKDHVENKNLSPKPENQGYETRSVTVPRFGFSHDSRIRVNVAFLLAYMVNNRSSALASAENKEFAHGL